MELMSDMVGWIVQMVTTYTWPLAAMMFVLAFVLGWGLFRTRAAKPRASADTEQVSYVADAMHKALDRGDIRLMYQPIIDLQEQRVAGFEALVRWRHPEYGEVNPMDLVDMAEKSDSLVSMGRRLRAQACRLLPRWQEVANDPRLYLSFNIADQEVLDWSLVSELKAYLDDHHLTPESIRIELVERMLLHEASREVLQRINKLGVPLFIDDFGTGFSSLSRLHDMPVSALKIDQSFVRQMPQSERSRKVVNSIVGLGQGLGVTLIAEGVENADELRGLAKLGCRYIQGFLFSAAVSEQAVPGLLREQGWVGACIQEAMPRQPLSAANP